MEFRQLADIVTKTGVTYEVAQDGTTRSVAKSGATKILKPQGKRISIAGKMIKISDLIKDAGWLSTIETSDPSNPNTDGEIFESIRTSGQYELFISTLGRLKHIFWNGYVVTKTAEEMCNEHKKHISDECPRIVVNGRHVKLNDVVVKIFIGEIPNGFCVCNTDGIKTNARLGNLRLVGDNEHVYVASFVDKKLEKMHHSKEAAVEHVINIGYSNAMIEELENVLRNMADSNVPAMVYGRTWIPVN
jgi:hypothetical protein